MAAVDELLRKLQKEAQCPVCLGTVTDPKTLPCLHSFCLTCLTTLQRRREEEEEEEVEPMSPGDTLIFDCPVCRKFVDIPYNFNDLPTSFHLNRLVDIFALEDGSIEVQTCSGCKGNSTASCYCFVCLEFMCSACFETHHRSKRTRLHRIENLQTPQRLGSSFCSQGNHDIKQPLKYFCQECRVCICQQCCEANHDGHSIIDIYDQEAVDAEQMQIRSVVDKVKQQVLEYQSVMDKQAELMEQSKEENLAAQRKVTETVEDLILVLRKHEQAAKAKLLEVMEAQKRDHARHLEKFQFLISQLRSFVEYGEAVLERKLNAEIFQARTGFHSKGEELLKAKKIELYYPQHVDYEVSRQATVDIQGHVTVKYADALKCEAKGKGLAGGDVGTLSSITVTIQDQGSEQFYHENNQMTVKVMNPQGKYLNTEMENYKNGKYTVFYTPESVGVHTVLIDINGRAVAGSPWNVEVMPHKYCPEFNFGTSGREQGQFDWPVSIAVSETTGNIAIADSDNQRIQLFSSVGEYLSEFGQSDVVTLNQPSSVAFASSGDIIVLDSGKIFQFDETGQSINTTTNECLKNPCSISIGHDDCLFVCDKGDKAIKVLSSDCKKLLISFSAPDCHTSPEFAICHQNKIFVSYFEENCVKVFDTEGQFLFDIGRDRSGVDNGQLIGPLGLAIDNYDQLVVCNFHNRKLRLFTLDGKFVGNIPEPDNASYTPHSVAVSNEGHVLVIDILGHSVQVFK